MLRSCREKLHTGLASSFSNDVSALNIDSLEGERDRSWEIRREGTEGCLTMPVFRNGRSEMEVAGEFTGLSMFWSYLIISICLALNLPFIEMMHLKDALAQCWPN